MPKTARARIESALVPYLPWESARLKSIELARILKETKNENEAREEIAEELGKLDIHHAIPAEIRGQVVDLVIRAWRVVPLDPGDKTERG